MELIKCGAHYAFRLQSFIKRQNSYQWLNFLEESQWWSDAKLKAYGQYRNKKLQYHVQENVPFYINKSHFPIISKDIIKQNFKNFISKKSKNIYLKKTSGSTGEPFQFYLSNLRLAHDVAAKWRVTRWFDVDIGDKEIVIWGSPIESSQQSFLKKLRDYMIRSYFVPASNLDNSIISNILKIIKKRQPKMLFGYPSIIFLIANYALRNKIKCSHLGIKVCFVTSEILDLTQKNIIQEVFNCIVVNGYGGRESGFIAHECPLGRMHITCEDIDVEINPIKLESNSQLGEVLITHYESSDFPFIRYQTGDLAELDNNPCECGRNHPILKNIEGRKSDLILSSNGKVIHRSTISTLIHSFKEIEQYTLHQSSITDYQLNIISENFEKKVKQLRKRLQLLFGNNSNINISQVDNISKSASGKRTYVTSNVKYELY